MELVGMLDSPYVRRVAVTAKFLGVTYEHRPISIFSQYDEFRTINPMVKIPTLICDDGSILVESTLIIDYFESISDSGAHLMPADPDNYRAALSQIGAALVAMEKTANLYYERSQRPEEKQHEPWKARLEQQLTGALDVMEATVAGKTGWIFGDDISQADISIAIAWRFVEGMLEDRFDLSGYSSLVDFSRRAERLPQFHACSY